MPAFPLLTQEQAGQFNNFLLARRGPTFPTLGAAPSMPQIATLQNPSAAFMRDQADELEAYKATVPTIVDPTLTDAELLRQQMGGGASALFDTSGARQTAAGGMDYGAAKPIRGGVDEIMANPKFAMLLRRAPEQAARAYQAITGRDLRNDFQQKQKLDLVRRKETSDTLRTQILKGEMRQNPETGFVERKTTIPDPNNPMQKIDAWETMDTEAQLAFNGSWEDAMGAKAARANPIASLQIPANLKPIVMSKYMSMVKAGTHSPAAALEEAIKSTPLGTQSSTAPSSQAAASPHAAAANPVPAPMPAAGPAYDAWATQQAQSNVGGAMAAPIQAALGVMPERQGPNNFEWAVNDWNRMSGNARKSIGNIPSYVSALFGGRPTWNRPETHEEMVARITAAEQARAAETGGSMSEMTPDERRIRRQNRDY